MSIHFNVKYLDMSILFRTFATRKRDINKLEVAPDTNQGKDMRTLRIDKDASKLIMLDKFFFVGNQNEIIIFRNWRSGRTYARARFEYDERFKCHLLLQWFELTKKDIEDDDAIDKTIEKICRHFGYFNVRPNPFNLIY